MTRTRAAGRRSRTILAPATVLAALALGGCATPVAPGGEPPIGIAAEGEVIGQGTVLQVGDAAPQFCLGGVMESYPPQCSGPDILGWDWAAVDGEESASGVTWGAYVVQGTWDGERFTVTQPPMILALYDPMPVDQPLRDPANAGTTSDERLQAIQDELNETAALRPLGSSAANGYLFATYLYDDGDLQRYLDATYGSGVVVVESALRSVAG